MMYYFCPGMLSPGPDSLIGLTGEVNAQVLGPVTLALDGFQVICSGVRSHLPFRDPDHLSAGKILYHLPTSETRFCPILSSE